MGEIVNAKSCEVGELEAEATTCVGVEVSESSGGEVAEAKEETPPTTLLGVPTGEDDALEASTSLEGGLICGDEFPTISGAGRFGAGRGVFAVDVLCFNGNSAPGKISVRASDAGLCSPRSTALLSTDETCTPGCLDGACRVGAANVEECSRGLAT